MAADSADQILEKARAKGQEIEKLKKVLIEDPDQNVRLTVFDLMINNGDPSMHDVAVDVGLSSADALLQAAAFKESIMGLDRLQLTLTSDSTSSEKSQKECKEWIAKNGSGLAILLNEKDNIKGSFTTGGMYASNKGEISGTLLLFGINEGNGTLQLEDDNALIGKINVGSQAQISCLVTAKFR